MAFDRPKPGILFALRTQRKLCTQLRSEGSEKVADEEEFAIGGRKREAGKGAGADACAYKEGRKEGGRRKAVQVSDQKEGQEGECEGEGTQGTEKRHVPGAYTLLGGGGGGEGGTRKSAAPLTAAARRSKPKGNEPAKGR